MNFRHRTRQRTQLRARLAALLHLPLQPTQYHIKAQPRLPRRAHATHTPQSLLGKLRPPLGRERREALRAPSTAHQAPQAVDAPRPRGNGGGVLRGGRLRLGLQVLVLLELLLCLVLLGARGDLGVLFVEDADDARGDFVVDDRFVVFADDVDAEFL